MGPDVNLVRFCQEIPYSNELIVEIDPRQVEEQIECKLDGPDMLSNPSNACTYELLYHYCHCIS
jgi:hypothetical protein